MSLSSVKLNDLLASIVKSAVDEARTADTVTGFTSGEQELSRQDDMTSRLSNLTQRRSTGDVIVDEEEEEEAPEAGEKEDVSNKDDAEKKASISMPSEIKFQDIRKLIDQVRSGKSLKDKETKLELVDYYEELDEPERISLYKFLFAISVILTKDVDGDIVPGPSTGKGRVISKAKTKVQAPDPNKKQIARSMDKKRKKRVVSKEKKAAPETEFMPPIKVGESQEKQSVIIEMLSTLN
jgi:hypothetical protein